MSHQDNYGCRDMKYPPEGFQDVLEVTAVQKGILSIKEFSHQTSWSFDHLIIIYPMRVT